MAGRKTFTKNNQPSAGGNGFTLIELLIVVAIISILAALAVPNFLEAQTRSKISRVKAEQKTLATALEAYAVEWNRYPPVRSTLTGLLESRLKPLSTPVAYLSTIPREPFTRLRNSNYAGIDSSIDPRGNSYVYNTANISIGAGSGGSGDLRRSQWSLASGGPDLTVDWPYYAFAQDFIDNGRFILFIYDPTNGTFSSGEIFRRGGGSVTPLPGVNLE